MFNLIGIWIGGISIADGFCCLESSSNFFTLVFNSTSSLTKTSIAWDLVSAASVMVVAVAVSCRRNLLVYLVYSTCVENLSQMFH